MSRSVRALAALALAGCAALAPATAMARSGPPPVRHVFVIVLENEAADTTFGPSSPAPYLSRTLRAKGAFVPNYYGTTHFSMGNYDALISGQGPTPQIQADCLLFTDIPDAPLGADGQLPGQGCVFPRRVKTIANQLTARGLSWKAYQEDMAAPCLHPAAGAFDTTLRARVGDQYATRHNPFVYFHAIIDSPSCARRDVPLTGLGRDLRSRRTTANLTWITPNLCHDGHDEPCVDGQPGGLVSADAFLKAWVPRILRSPAYRRDGLLAVLFDEGLDAASCCGQVAYPNVPAPAAGATPPGGGRTGAVLLSRFIRPGTRTSQPYNHFAFLRSMEDLFGLGHLGYAARRGLRPLGADVFTKSAPRR